MKKKKRSAKAKAENNQRNLILGLMLLITVVFLVSVVDMEIKANRKLEELERVELLCQEQQLENEQLADLLENVGDEYIIRLAREELDFIFPGERIYKIRPGN